MSLPSEGPTILKNENETVVEIMTQMKDNVFIYSSELVEWVHYVKHLVEQRLPEYWSSLVNGNWDFWGVFYLIGIPIIVLLIIGFLLNATKLRSLVRAKNCRICVEWNRACPNRVGGTVEVKIVPRSSSSFRLSEPLDPEIVSDLLQHLNVKVVVENNDQVQEEEILPQKDLNLEDSAVIVSFAVIRSGLYRIFVAYKGFPVRGSPFSAIMEADDLDASKSYVITPSRDNPMVIVAHKQFKIDIIPVDGFGNRCGTSTDNMRRLHMLVKSTEIFPPSSSIEEEFEGLPSPTDELETFRLHPGIRRENPEEPELRPLYTIYGKCIDVGLFMAKFSFGCCSIPGVTKIMAISQAEEKRVLEAKATCNFKAEYVLSGREEEEMRCVDVQVHLTPKFLYLTFPEFGGLFQRRMSTYRLSSAKLRLVSFQDEPFPETYILQLSEEHCSLSQKPEEILMTGEDGRVLLSLFYEFQELQKDSNSSVFRSLDLRSRGKLSLNHRIETFYSEIRNSFLNEFDAVVDGDGPIIGKHPYRCFSVSRTDIVSSTYEATKAFTRLEWSKPFIVSFKHEPVNRDASAWIDWCVTFLSEFFGQPNRYGPFLAQNYNRSSRPGLLHPNPERHSKWGLRHYELLGKVMGKVLVQNAFLNQPEEEGREFHIDARLSRTLYASLLGVPPTHRHLQIDDPAFWQTNVEPVLLAEDVSKLNLTFSLKSYLEPLSSTSTESEHIHLHRLLENGENIGVTNDNRIEYAYLLSQVYLIDQVKDELKAFVDGVSFVVPRDHFMMFDENELELLFCGASRPWDLEHLVNDYTVSSTGNPRFAQVKMWLRQVFEEMDDLEIGKLYQFITGCSKLPHKTGWVPLKPLITLAAKYGQKPTSNKMNCHLTLNDHRSYEEFRKALFEALEKDGLEY